MRNVHAPAYRAFLVKLRAARKLAGLTQVQVGEALGIPQGRVSDMEKGERRIDVIELEELAILYGKSLKWFMPPRK